MGESHIANDQRDVLLTFPLIELNLAIHLALVTMSFHSEMNIFSLHFCHVNILSRYKEISFCLLIIMAMPHGKLHTFK